MHDPAKFRASVYARIEQFPELFPAEITAGYRMKDIKESKKLSIPIRRIEVSGISYTIRPSFVMPYMTGFVKNVEKGLFLRKHDVPFGGWVMFLVEMPCTGIELKNPLVEIASLVQQ
ncbi:MAG: hypothetical protein C4B58_05840 [Deltaproteobacteria bacterium]|nr:MAG: hypothetical protein C4B58_05840 [Deltaproteobacteria bacterium]